MKKKYSIKKKTPLNLKKKKKSLKKIKEILNLVDNYTKIKYNQLLFLDCYNNSKLLLQNKINDIVKLLKNIKKQKKSFKKNCNLNQMYTSYKSNLNELLKIKRKLIYFNYLSKPILNESDLQKLVEHQSNMVTKVQSLTNAIKII